MLASPKSQLQGTVGMFCLCSMLSWPIAGVPKTVGGLESLPCLVPRLTLLEVLKYLPMASPSCSSFSCNSFTGFWEGSSPRESGHLELFLQCMAGWSNHTFLSLSLWVLTVWCLDTRDWWLDSHMDCSVEAPAQCPAGNLSWCPFQGGPNWGEWWISH